MVTLRRTESVRRSVTTAPRSRRCDEQRAFRRNVTFAILLPALRAHVLRRPGRALDAIIAALERRLRTLVQQGKPGLPLRCWVRDGVVNGQVRLGGVPECFMVIEGLSPRALARCLRRKGVSRALRGVPVDDDPDIATSFSIAARCSWVLR